MTDYEHQKMKEKIAKRGKFLIWTGLPISIVGIILLIVGIINGFGYAAIGGFTMIIGLSMVAFGLQFHLASKAGKISRYFAKATGGSTKYTTEKVTDGFATGLEKHGMSIGGGKEVVKIKCRNCGYLETEDAEFCSKCGQVM